MAALGLLGGTFDPIHCAHLEMAREVKDALGLAAVHLIPVGDPPHRHAPVASAADRLAMLALAVADYPGLVVDDREVRRQGPSYTVLTLSELRAQAPTRPLALLLGADQFLALPTWHRWRDVLGLAHIVVVARPGMPLPATPAAPLDGEWRARHTTDIAVLAKTPAGAVFVQAITPHAISASMIRAALAKGDMAAVRGLLPPAVLAYIEHNHLYVAPPDAT
jgi:nicotinate-nucleotide adenylyltransferase